MKKLKIAFMLAAIVIFFSCLSSSKESEIKQLLLDLKNPDSITRFNAIDRLGSRKFNEQQSILLIAAATGKYPPAKYEWQTIPGILITAATKEPSVAFIAPVKNNFEKMDPNARENALIFLSGFDNRQSIRAFTDLAIQYKNEITSLPTGILGKNLHYKDIIFPRLMELLENEKLAPEVLLLLLNQLEAQNERAEKFQSDYPRIYSLNNDFLQRIVKKQAGFISMNDIWDDDEYSEWRRNAGIILDLMGYLKHEGILNELNKYLRQKDNKLKMFAAVSLIRQGEKMDEQTLLEIAADPESRNLLYDKLVALNKPQYFPVKYRTQEDFAESDMVNWLLYPTELARMPAKIELMKIIRVDTEADGEVEFYIYRFQSDHSNWKDEGWMAGVAGYYKISEKPSTTANGYTFSSFEKWEGKTAEEQLGDISDIIKKAEKNLK